MTDPHFDALPLDVGWRIRSAADTALRSVHVLIEKMAMVGWPVDEDGGYSKADQAMGLLAMVCRSMGSDPMQILGIAQPAVTTTQLHALVDDLIGDPRRPQDGVVYPINRPVGRAMRYELPGSFPWMEAVTREEPAVAVARRSGWFPDPPTKAQRQYFWKVVRETETDEARERRLRRNLRLADAAVQRLPNPGNAHAQGARRIKARNILGLVLDEGYLTVEDLEAWGDDEWKAISEQAGHNSNPSENTRFMVTKGLRWVAEQP